jgi:hypothetical protein
VNTQSTAPSTERAGKIVQTVLDGVPILWTLVPELPDEQVRRATPWLTVVSWVYDGSSKNGMPDGAIEAQMQDLEGAITQIERPGVCHEAYRRIGRDLREFVFYISDRDQFLEELNERLARHPRYPIEIKFFEDPLWSDFKQLIDDLSLA